MNKHLLKMILILLTGSALCAMAETPDGAGRPDGKKMRERMLKQFDKDGDGQLSESEKATAKAAMDERKAKLDTDGDGKISDAERKAAHENMIARLDTNGDGEISEAEHKAAGKKKDPRPAAE